MITLGLTAQDERLFNAGLAESHDIKIRAYILDLNHNHIEDVSDRFIDGQVNVDTSRDVTHDLSITLADRGLMTFESGTFSTGSNYARYMIQVFYGVKSRSFPQWVWVPVFCGPIQSFSREEAVVTMTAQGKESLLRTKSWVNRAYVKGILKTALIEDILRKNGETRFEFPSWSTKTDRPVTLTPEKEVWPFLQSLAGSWGTGRLTYDARGYARLFAYNFDASRWNFKGGQGGTLSTVPNLTYSVTEDFVNAARVYGPTPSGTTKQVFGEYVAPADNPLSPRMMARNGVPQYYAEIVRDANVTTNADAQKLAKALVDQSLMQTIQVTFECLPVPTLEPWDVVTVTTSNYSTPFLLNQFSLPLNDSNNMTVGFNSKVSRWKR